jgi:hypothetical protein
MEIHTKPTSHADDTNDTHTQQKSKPELGPVVCKQFCISLDASRRLNKHVTGAPPSYTPLVFRPPPPVRIVGDPRVQKLAIHESRMTRVVNGVRHTSLRDTLDRRNC